MHTFWINNNDGNVSYVYGDIQVVIISMFGKM